jgi:hypothetical protein
MGTHLGQTECARRSPNLRNSLSRRKSAGEIVRMSDFPAIVADAAKQRPPCLWLRPREGHSFCVRGTEIWGSRRSQVYRDISQKGAVRRRRGMRHCLKYFKTSLSGFLAGFVTLACASVFALDIKAWEDSTNSETKERYIPVELWSGSEWDGKRELKMPRVDGSYRHHSNYQIKGPTEWKHPVTGQTYTVLRKNQSGKGWSEVATLYR